MSTPSPALVTQAAVRRLPPLALVLFVLCYVMAGFWGREPWKTIDMGSLGVMLDLVSGRSSWLAPTFLGQTPEAPALLPYWLGAWALALAPTNWDAAWVSRLPFVLLLTLTLASTWKAIELLARSRGAQPVAFAFGGEAKADDYARVMADAGLLALMACLGLAQASHEVTPMAVQLCLASLLFCGLAGLGSARGWAHLALAVASLWGLLFTAWGWLPTLVFAALVAVGVHDLTQTKRAVLRNYPVIGHMRFFLEYIRPEMRQYFIESDTEAAPFSRSQRSLVYQRAKGEPDKRPFGTQLDVFKQGYEWINHSLAPTLIDSHDFRLTIGPERAQPYSASVFNISGMSFGALSANAILALNAGAKAGGFAHDTGEGSISPYQQPCFKRELSASGANVNTITFRGIKLGYDILKNISIGIFDHQSEEKVVECHACASKCLTYPVE